MAKILLIDDSRFARLRMKDFLRDSGFEVVEAGDGSEGLEKLESEKPDCVICDLLMPVLDGFGLLEAVKTKGISTPVLILTSDIQEKTRARALELGAVDLINKPPKYDEVVDQLKKYIGE